MWDISTSDIRKISKDVVKSINATYRKIMKIPKDQQTFENTLGTLSKTFNTATGIINKITFLQYVHSDDDVRKASKKADVALENFYIELEMREDIFHFIDSIDARFYTSLDSEDKRYLDLLRRSYKRSGMYISDKTKRERLQTIQKEISELSSSFGSNIINDNTTLSFSKEELAGIPAHLFDDFECVGNKYVVPIKPPFMTTLLKYVDDGEIRKMVDQTSKSKCIQNLDLLYKLTILRKEYAEILGYKSYAEYILEIRMAKTPDTVDKFLNSLISKLKIPRNKELTLMKSMKNFKVDIWDKLYYDHKYKKDKYGIDDSVIEQYFYMDHVLSTMFQQYQELFDVQIAARIPHETLWDAAVKEYDVHSRSGELLGTFVLDLYTRINKFEHYACFPIINRINDKDRRVVTPAYCALVCNFKPPNDVNPSLLQHAEIETLYHEFGHVIHTILGGAEHSLFSGTHVEWDFVEMPSQMLENLCWEFENIKKLSKHWKTREQLNDGDISMLISTRNINISLEYCRQILFAKIDQVMHGSREIKSAAELDGIFKEMCVDILGFEEQPNSSDLSLFGHLASGYAASYYGYLWSEVYAHDIYGVLRNTPLKWQDYRTKILEYGGSKPAYVMLCDFLGREPDSDAFISYLL